MSQLMVVSMLVFFTVSGPVAVSIGLASIVGVGVEGQMTLRSMHSKSTPRSTKSPLVGLPFFIRPATYEGSGSRRHGRFCQKRGWCHAGRACLQLRAHLHDFAAVAGSSVATTFALGAILPAMVKQGTPSRSPRRCRRRRPSWVSSTRRPYTRFCSRSPPIRRGELLLRDWPGILSRRAEFYVCDLCAPANGYGKNDGQGRAGPWPLPSSAPVWPLLMPVIILGALWRHPSRLPSVGGSRGLCLVVGCFVYRRLRFPALSHTCTVPYHHRRNMFVIATMV